MIFFILKLRAHLAHFELQNFVASCCCVAQLGDSNNIFPVFKNKNIPKCPIEKHF